MRGRTTHSVARLLAATAVTFALTAQMTGIAHASASQYEAYRYRRDRIEERARSQRGTPYRYGGTSPGGFDCSGFTRWVFQRFKSLPHSSMAQFDLGNSGNNKRVWKRTKLEVGDLVFQRTTSARVGHAGIYVGHGRFISSTNSGGVQVNSLYDGYWGPRWVGATRLPVTMRYKP